MGAYFLAILLYLVLIVLFISLAMLADISGFHDTGWHGALLSVSIAASFLNNFLKNVPEISINLLAIFTEFFKARYDYIVSCFTTSQTDNYKKGENNTPTESDVETDALPYPTAAKT